MRVAARGASRDERDAALLETGEGCDPVDGSVCGEEGSDCEECG